MTARTPQLEAPSAAADSSSQSLNARRVGSPGVNSSAVMTGTARLISPLHPGEIAAAFPRTFSVQSAITSWARRNPLQIFGFLRDSLTNPMRVIPIDQVFVGFRPETTSFVQFQRGPQHRTKTAPDVCA
ncbi:hypothetical protein ACU5JM_00765 (plasmid) [Rhodococcus erythropolis]|uniref:hypothetical protein n=1 Tax=Rhodococcus erythropolis TaxID=1833 RepID=UPI00406BD985